MVAYLGQAMPSLPHMTGKTDDHTPIKMVMTGGNLVKVIFGWFPHIYIMIPVRENPKVILVYPDRCSCGIDTQIVGVWGA